MTTRVLEILVEWAAILILVDRTTSRRLQGL
jgi:hypothetical protein